MKALSADEGRGGLGSGADEVVYLPRHPSLIATNICLVRSLIGLSVDGASFAPGMRDGLGFG